MLNAKPEGVLSRRVLSVIPAPPRTSARAYYRREEGDPNVDIKVPVFAFALVEDTWSTETTVELVPVISDEYGRLICGDVAERGNDEVGIPAGVPLNVRGYYAVHGAVTREGR